MRFPHAVFAITALFAVYPCVTNSAESWETRAPEGVSAVDIAYDNSTGETRLWMAGAWDAWSTRLDTPSWSKVGLDLPNSPQGIVLDPVNTGAVLVDAEESLLRVLPGGDVETLQVGDYFDEVAISADGNHIYVAGYNDGIFYSADGGTTFALSDSPLPDGFANKLLVHPDNPTTAYAFYYGAIFRTTNGGINWTRWTVDSTSPNSLAFDPTNSSQITLVGDDGTWNSDDGGATWTEVSTALEGGRGLDVIYSGDGSRLLKRSTASTLEISEDGGSTWTSVEPGIADLVVLDMESRPDSANEFALATPAGIMRSTDAGASWQFINNDIYKINVNSLARDGNGLLVINTYSHGVYVSPDDGITWNSVNSGPLGPADSGYPTAIDPYQTNVLLAANLYSIARSVDSGTTWSDVYTAYAMDFHFTSVPGEVLATTQDGVLHSIDSGETWAPLNSDTLNASNAYSVTSSPDGKRWFVATRDGLFVSDDGGATWFTAVEKETSSVAISASDPNILYAAGDGMIFRSSDAGSTWRAREASVSPFALVVHPQDSDVVFGGTLGYGIHFSLDGGKSWQPASETDLGLVRDLELDDDVLWAATSRNSLNLSGSTSDSSKRQEKSAVPAHAESLNRMELKWGKLQVQFNAKTSTAAALLTAKLSLSSVEGIATSGVHLQLKAPSGLTLSDFKGMSCEEDENTFSCLVGGVSGNQSRKVSFTARADALGDYVVRITASANLHGGIEVDNGGAMKLSFKENTGGSASSSGGGAFASLAFLLLALGFIRTGRRRRNELEESLC